MKPLQSLILLAADRDFRLVRANGGDLSEISQRQTTDFADLSGGFEPNESRNRANGISFGNSDLGGREAEDRRRFARHAVQALETEWAKGRADRILLAAGPKMLGELRDALPKALTGHIAAELHKDLIQVPLHDLPSHFQNVTRL